MPLHKKAYTAFSSIFLALFLGLLVFEGLCRPCCSRTLGSADLAVPGPGLNAQGDGALLWYPLAPIIGKPGRHTIAARETLLDIARRAHLGYNELEDLYPSLDPWVPPPGVTLTIPAQRILPGVISQGIVINIPEMRLYYIAMTRGIAGVLTFPIGIGDASFPTPVGTYRISSKEVNPTWNIPPSLQKKHQAKMIPAGPNNPLGSHWMRLGSSMYGIHGTNFPWSVGRLATHGCIRLYPEDIRKLFPVVPQGTMVRLIYQPVKLAVLNGRIYIEVHRDVYKVYGNLMSYCEKLLAAKNIGHLIDRGRLRRAVAEQHGMPVEITGSVHPSPETPPRHPGSRIRINPFPGSPRQPRP